MSTICRTAGIGFVLSGTLLTFSGGCSTSDSQWPCRGAERLLRSGVEEGAFPGAVLMVGVADTVRCSVAVGHYGVNDRRPVTDSTIYDLASLTKVIGLTTAVMLLVGDGALELETPVVAYVQEFQGDSKELVTILHLLTHTSGLPAWRPIHLETTTKEQALDSVFAASLETAPGTEYTYSDFGAITLGVVVERIAGVGLDDFLDDRVFGPLGMQWTGFLPPDSLIDLIAPTENDPWRGRVLRGEVHDENAARLGGVAGHAGLFSIGPDIARFAEWMIDAYHDRLSPTAHPQIPAAVVRNFVERQNGPGGSTRALGWDTPSAGGSSAGTILSRSSFGHTGFTGTSIWIDPDREIYIVLLTNRVHPTRGNNAIRSIRSQVADSVMTAILARSR